MAELSHSCIRLVQLGLCLAVLALAGCQSGGPSELERDLMRGGAPHPSEVLRDLAANDEALQSFDLSVSFTFKAPEITAAITKGRGRVAYARPDRMYLRIEDRNFGKDYLRIAVADGIAHVWTPDREEFWRDGDPIEGLPFEMGPTELVREIFVPEAWAQLPPRDRHLVAFDEERQEAVLSIGPEAMPRRMITVRRIKGPVWVLAENVLYDRGLELARTTFDKYENQDGIRFPNFVETRFPQADAWIRMDVREHASRFNEKLRDEYFESLDR